MPTLLKIKNIGFSYETVEVLSGVSFEIQKGDFWGIIGPNGSGKSTLLKLLDGILSPQEGRIILNGVDMGEFSRRELSQKIAALWPQRQFAFPVQVLPLVLTGRAPYLSGLLRFESKEDYKVAEKAMELTGITDFAQRYYHELSAGEKQRVLIARALAQQPDLLLLDEPTSYLDIKHKLALFELLKEMNQETGLTVVTVSHDINLAADYCNKLVLLHDTRIFSLGDPARVITTENIKSVYECRVLLDKNPATGMPRITPIATSV